jgi:hypothetical protein
VKISITPWWKPVISYNLNKRKILVVLDKAVEPI